MRKKNKKIENETKRNKQKSPTIWKSIGRQERVGKIRKRGAGISLPTSHPPFLHARSSFYLDASRTQAANKWMDWFFFKKKIKIKYFSFPCECSYRTSGRICQSFFFFSFPSFLRGKKEKKRVDCIILVRFHTPASVISSNPNTAGRRQVTPAGTFHTVNSSTRVPYQEHDRDQDCTCVAILATQVTPSSPSSSPPLPTHNIPIHPPIHKIIFFSKMIIIIKKK